MDAHTDRRMEGAAPVVAVTLGACLSYPSSPPPGLCEPLDDAPAGPLYSAVLNALQNAIAAVIRTGGSGKVHVLTRRDVLSMDGSGRGARVILDVHDEGVGLPPPMPSVRLLGLGGPPKGGTGAGLGAAVWPGDAKEGRYRAMRRLSDLRHAGLVRQGQPRRSGGPGDAHVVADAGADAGTVVEGGVTIWSTEFGFQSGRGAR